MIRINLDESYIGIVNSVYDHDAKIGLFVKSDIVPTEREHFLVQYYQDMLSDTRTALWLNNDGKDKVCDFSRPLVNDPEEMVNWNGVRGTVGKPDTDYYKIPAITDEVDRHICLVKFTSVYPNLIGEVSIEKIVECLADYSSKFELKVDSKKQILDSLKEIPQYFASKGTEIPIFENIPMNESDLSQVPENINSRKSK